MALKALEKNDSGSCGGRLWGGSGAGSGCSWQMSLGALWQSLQYIFSHLGQNAGDATDTAAGRVVSSFSGWSPLLHIVHTIFEDISIGERETKCLGHL